MALALSSTSLHAEGDTTVNTEGINWKRYAYETQLLKQADYRNGLSYIISGTIALAGGIWGANITDDAVEKGIYTVFQTIGVASVGYGAYVWQVGGEERSLYDTLNYAKGLSDREKTIVLRSYYFQKKEKERKERIIKAITHSLVAGLNLYNASQQKEVGVKNALIFIGGVNLLAAISFTFDF